MLEVAQDPYELLPAVLVRASHARGQEGHGGLAFAAGTSDKEKEYLDDAVEGLCAFLPERSFPGVVILVDVEEIVVCRALRRAWERLRKFRKDLPGELRHRDRDQTKE